MLMPDPQTTSQSPSCCSCCQSWHESFCSWGSSSNVSSWAKGTVSLHFWKENRLQLDLPVPWKQFPTVEIIALALWSSSPMISSWEKMTLVISSMTLNIWTTCQNKTWEKILRPMAGSLPPVSSSPSPWEPPICREPPLPSYCLSIYDTMND